MQQPTILLVSGRGQGTDQLDKAIAKAGYILLTVHTGAAAIELIKGSDDLPDLVLVDATSMRSNGARITKWVRDFVGHVVPIIHCRPAGVAVDPSAGADRYLEQPFGPRKLLNRIRTLLPADQSEEETIRHGPIIFYRKKRTVDTKGTGEQRLTPKLTQLLTEFLRYPNQLITREQIMMNVWETDFLDDTRTLDVHVRWMREKIEVDPAQPRILRTVRGRGYIFFAGEAEES